MTRKYATEPWVAEWSTITNGGPKCGWHVFNPETVDVDGIVCDIPDGADAECNARLIAEAPAMSALLGTVARLTPYSIDSSDDCLEDACVTLNRLIEEANALLSRIEEEF